MSKRMQNWIATLMDGLDEHVDDEGCRAVLERCGRECIPKSRIRKAKDLYDRSESLEDFLERYAASNEHLRLEDDGVFMVYPRCFCSLVNKMPEGQMSPTWCNCSVGWVKALFEGATGRSVGVILEKSVIKGDDGCRLMVVFK